MCFWETVALLALVALVAVFVLVGSGGVKTTVLSRAPAIKITVLIQCWASARREAQMCPPKRPFLVRFGDAGGPRVVVASSLRRTGPPQTPPKAPQHARVCALEAAGPRPPRNPKVIQNAFLMLLWNRGSCGSCGSCGFFSACVLLCGAL